MAGTATLAFRGDLHRRCLLAAEREIVEGVNVFPNSRRLFLWTASASLSHLPVPLHDHHNSPIFGSPCHRHAHTLPTPCPHLPAA